MDVGVSCRQAGVPFGCAWVVKFVGEFGERLKGVTRRGYDFLWTFPTWGLCIVTATGRHSKEEEEGLRAIPVALEP